MALHTLQDGRGCAAKAEKTALSGRLGLGKIQVVALCSLFSDRISDDRVENEERSGGIYRGLRRVDFHICPR